MSCVASVFCWSTSLHTVSAGMNLTTHIHLFWRFCSPEDSTLKALNTYVDQNFQFVDSLLTHSENTRNWNSLHCGFPSQIWEGRALPIPWTSLRERGRSGATPYTNQAWTYSTQLRQRPCHDKDRLLFPHWELTSQKPCDLQSAKLVDILGKPLSPLWHFFPCPFFLPSPMTWVL